MTTSTKIPPFMTLTLKSSLLFAVVGFSSPLHASDLTRLFYHEPAEHWTEALPVGNGRLGAMVVDRTGGAFVTDVGQSGSVVRIDAPNADGQAGPARVALAGHSGLAGLAITPDGNTLLIAQGSDHAAHVLQSRIAADGSLGEPRSHIALGGVGALGGMALARNGSLWLCLPQQHRSEVWCRCRN